MHVNYEELIQEALNLPGQMGNTYNRFYRYSYMNQCLLHHQGVAEPVATYKAWAGLGRQVKKGSSAKYIVRPVMYKTDKEDDKAEIKGFMLKKCLFGLSETDGEELPEPELNGFDIERALNNLDITRVEFKNTNGNIQGYSFKRSIAINPLAVEKVPTLFHEIGHIVAGHTDQSNTEHRGVQEFQAEAISFLVMKELGEPFNESESRAYIQNWLKGRSAPKGWKAEDTIPSEQAIKQVFGAVNKILTAGQA